MKRLWTLWATVALLCAVAVVLVVVATGQASAAEPEAVPTLTVVDPPSAPNDLDSVVAISGTGFAEVPTVSLGSNVLEEVGWLSAERLTATVPWGLEPGVYTLTVANPGGDAAEMAGAFTVTEGIGVWTTGGPYGGRVQFVTLHPEDATKVYAASMWTGLFASEDSGQSWQAMLPIDWPSRLAFDAADSSIMYYSGDSATLFRTDDGGQNWQSLPMLFYSQNGCYTVYVAAHPVAGEVVYAATGSCAGIPVLPGEGGVFYSDDHGENWVTRTQGLTDTDLVDIAFHPGDPDTMVVASRSGHIFRTTDAGLDWDWMATLPSDLRRLQINPYGAHEYWAIPEIDYQPPVAPYLYRSADLTTWEVVTPTNDPMPSGGIWSLAFAPGEVWAAGDWGYVSDDGGATWTGVIDQAQQIGGLRSFAFDPGDASIIYAADSNQGVLKSSDGGVTWAETNEGLAALTTRDLAAAPNDPDVVYVETFEYGLLKSANGGYAWQNLGVSKGGPPKGKLIAVDPFVPSRVYYPQGCSGNGPCSWYSEDAGDTWNEVTMPVPVTYTGWTGELTTIAAHPLVSGTLFAGAAFYKDRSDFDHRIEPCGIYRSTDYGESWDFLGPTPAISEVLEIAFDAVDPDLIYATTHGDGLWRSTDGGTHWAPLPIADTAKPLVVEAIVTHPDLSGKVYLRTYSYAESPNPEPELWLSDNGGDSWQQMAYVFLGVDLLISPQVPGQAAYTLYTGCEAGLCSSSDDGQSWAPVEGAPRPEFLAGASDGEREVIYLGSPGGLVTSVGQRSILSADSLPGEGSVLGSGVYRLTRRLGGHRVFLPVIWREYRPE